jgi:hypothetical protein
MRSDPVFWRHVLLVLISMMIAVAQVVALRQTPATAGVGPIGASQPVPLIVLDWAVVIPLLFAGGATLITAVGGVIISVRNGKKSDAIHVLVNSGMSKALADLATSQEEIRVLRELVTSLNVRVVGALPSGDVQTVADAAKLPSAEVQAAQAATPAFVERRKQP